MIVHLDMDTSFSRPVVSVNSLFFGCKALIDTGALFPVWTAPEENLKDLGVLLDNKVSYGKINGIGGEASGNIYRITFDLNGIHYIELPIIAIRQECRFHMLMPSTIFHGMDFDINYQTKTININTYSNQTVYHLHHKTLDDNHVILCNV